MKMRVFVYYWNAERDCETTPANATHIMVLYEDPCVALNMLPSRSWRMFAI